MKKLLPITTVILFATAIALFSACGKGNMPSTDIPTSTTTTSNINNLIGKWYYNIDTLATYTGSTLDSTRIYDYFESNYLQFNSDGTGVRYADTTSTNFTYSVNSGSTILFKFANTPKQSSIKPQSLKVLAESSVNQQAAITQLTATNLILIFSGVPSGNNTIVESLSLNK